MGLGKTIQTLTRVVEGKPSKADLEKAKNAYMKATLYVVSGRKISGLPILRHFAGLLLQSASCHNGRLKSRNSHPDCGSFNIMDPSERQVRIPMTRLAFVSKPYAIDSNDFVRADVVVTTYTTLSSEHSKFVAESSKTRASGKEESEGSSDDSVIGKSIASKTKSSARAKKGPMCALFRTGFWRIVLGMSSAPVGGRLIHRLISKMKLKTSRTAPQEARKRASTSKVSIDGCSLALPSRYVMSQPRFCP